MDKAIVERLHNGNVRFEKMFWIPAQTSHPCQDFEEFFEDEYDDAVATLFPFLEPLLKMNAEPEELVGEFAFRQKYGFLVQAATPVPYDMKKSGAHGFSWGHYSTRWIYGDTLESVAEQACTWAEQIVEDAKSKAAA